MPPSASGLLFILVVMVGLPSTPPPPVDWCQYCDCLRERPHMEWVFGLYKCWDCTGRAKVPDVSPSEVISSGRTTLAPLSRKWTTRGGSSYGINADGTVWAKDPPEALSAVNLLDSSLRMSYLQVSQDKSPSPYQAKPYR